MDLFPLSKLKKLPVKTALRKIISILQKIEVEWLLTKKSRQVKLVDEYLKDLWPFLEEEIDLGKQLEVLKKDIIREDELNDKELLHRVNRLRHFLKNYLGQSSAEWDLLDLETGHLDSNLRKIFPIKIYLEDIRSPYNLGSIFRSAEAFGVAEIILSPFSAAPTHPRAQRTARGAEKVLQWSTAELASLPQSEPIFALETGGTPLHHFAFPKKGIVLIGNEELGLSPQALKLAELSAGLVSIPQYGAKRSLNVAVACGILLEHWSLFLAKPS